MSFLGSALGGVIGAVGNFLGTKQQQNYNRSNMDHANDQNTYNYQHRYQWTMDDLKESGLNPILAATQGGLAGSVNGASALSGSAPDIGGGFAAGMSSSAQSKQAKTQEKVGESTVALNSSSARKMDADAGLAGSQKTQIDNANKLFNATFESQKALYDQNLANAQKQGDYLDAQREGQIYNNTVLLPAMTQKAISEGSMANSAAAYHLANADYIGSLKAGSDYNNTMQQKFGFTPTGSLTGNIAGMAGRGVNYVQEWVDDYTKGYRERYNKWKANRPGSGKGGSFASPGIGRGGSF